MRKLITLACAGALGVAAPLALAACGEDRGGVEVESSTTGTTGTTGTTSTTPSATPTE